MMQPNAPQWESAVDALRTLENERHEFLNEAEYREARRAIIEELAHGVRWRPFTLFTFGTLAALLIGLTLLGLLLGREREPMGYLLAGAGASALLIEAWWLWRLHRGLREQARLPLAERLAELEALRAHDLITLEEYSYILGGIVSSRHDGATAARVS